MADKPIPQKLLIKSGYQCLVLNAPAGYALSSSELPVGVSISAVPKSGAKYDLVQLFVRSSAELSAQLSQAVSVLKSGGSLWLCYPKKSGAIKTDISRDKGWDAVIKLGFEGVTLIAIDETWSAMRFRPITETNRRSG